MCPPRSGNFSQDSKSRDSNYRRPLRTVTISRPTSPAAAFRSTPGRSEVEGFVRLRCLHTAIHLQRKVGKLNIIPMQPYFSTLLLFVLFASPYPPPPCISRLVRLYSIYLHYIFIVPFVPPVTSQCILLLPEDSFAASQRSIFVDPPRLQPARSGPQSLAAFRWNLAIVEAAGTPIAHAVASSR